MDQNQTVDNDLQKAIDDITNTTSVDPVFSDPIAAPSSVPEGDTGELDEPVGPFPEPKIEVPTPEQVAPAEPTNLPNFNLPDFAMPSMPPAPNQPTSTTFNQIPAAPALNIGQIKEAALRDLIPLLDRLNMGPAQKFKIYRNIFENLHDHTVLEPAYKAATEIPNETERAEALLYLIETIDRM